MTRAKFTAKGTQGTRSRECPGWLSPFTGKELPQQKQRYPLHFSLSSLLSFTL